ncbi:hypothetical protein FJZ31_22945 [Candidatus Poribacteria bacterium]|nr:hypothetical protein [Candidatus Poribacteria bacterium]
MKTIARIHRINGHVSDKRGKMAKGQVDKRAKQLGRLYTLPEASAKRLKELVEKEDGEEHLTISEKRELKQLLKEHEELMVKRAQALGELI